LNSVTLPFRLCKILGQRRTLVFDQHAEVPQELVHTLHFTSPDKTTHTHTPALLAVSQDAAVVVPFASS
jgi:hypothetical protein